MDKDQIIALLERRIAFLAAEADRNKRSGYAEAMRQKRIEVEYLLQKIKELAP